MRAECFRKALMRKENKDYKHLKKEDTAPAGSTGRKLPWILFAVLIVAVLLGSVVLGMNYRGKAFGPAGTAAPDGQDVSETEDAGQEDAKPSETEPEKSGTGKEKTADAGEKTYKVFIETGHGIDENGKWDPGCSWSDGTETYEEARIMIPADADEAGALALAKATPEIAALIDGKTLVKELYVKGRLINIVVR